MGRFNNKGGNRGGFKVRGGAIQKRGGGRGGRGGQQQQGVRRPQHQGGRGGGNRGRGAFKGGRGRGGRGRGRGAPRNIDASALDADLDSYMLKDKEVGKKHLDIALDDYFSQKGKGKAEPAAAAAAAADEAAMQS